MNNLFLQIESNLDKIYDQNWSYEFLYKNFNRGNLNNIDPEDLERLLLRLNLKVMDVFYSAAKNNHIDFVKYILIISANTCLEFLQLTVGGYGRALVTATENNNIEVLRLLVEILSEKDLYDKIRVNVNYKKIGITSKHGIEQIICVGKFLLELLDSKLSNKNLDSISETAYTYINEKYLTVAFINAALTSHIEFFDYIFNLTQSPETKYNLIYNNDWAILAEVVYLGHLGIIKRIFEIQNSHKIILNIILKHDRLLLRSAAGGGHIEIIKYLLEFIPSKYLGKILYLKNNKIYNESIKSNNIDVIKYLFELVEDQVIRDKIVNINNFILFKIACSHTQGSIEVLKYLMSYIFGIQGIKKIISHENYILFRHAAGNGRLDLMKYLVELVSDHKVIQDMIHSVNNEPFIHAARLGRMDVLKFLIGLLQNERSIKKMIDNDHYAVLLSATCKGQIDILKYLVEIYPQERFIDKWIHEDSYMAFKIAVENGRVNVIKFFMEHSNCFNSITNILSSIYYKSRVFGPAESSAGIALRRGHIEVIKYLLELGALQSNKKFFFPEQLINCTLRVKTDDQLCSFELFKLLLEKSNDSEKIKHIILSEDYLASLLALNGRVEFFEYLLTYLPSKNNKDLFIHKVGYLAFIFAAEFGHIEIVKLLVNVTFVEQIRNEMIHSNYDRAFSDALSNGHIDILNFLIELTPDFDARKKMIYQGSKKFKVAAEKGILESMKFIVELAPELIGKMLKDDNFYAFRKASEYGRFYIIKYLIDLSETVDMKEESNFGGFFKDVLNPFMSKLFLSSCSQTDSLLANLTDNNIDDFNYSSIESFKDKMIHAKNDEAFRMAASNEHLGCMNFLLAQVNDTESKKKMIRSNDDQVIKEAIKNGKIHIVEFLLESFLDKESNDKIIYPELEEAISNNELVKYLGEIDPSADLSFIDFVS